MYNQIVLKAGLTLIPRLNKTLKKHAAILIFVFGKNCTLIIHYIF
jgi:actin-related protein